MSFRNDNPCFEALDHFIHIRLMICANEWRLARPRSMNRMPRQELRTTRYANTHFVLYHFCWTIWQWVVLVPVIDYITNVRLDSSAERLLTLAMRFTKKDEARNVKYRRNEENKKKNIRLMYWKRKPGHRNIPNSRITFNVTNQWINEKISIFCPKSVSSRRLKNTHTHSI